MLLVTYRRRAVALAGTERVYRAPEIAELDDGQPLKIFVCVFALYARDVQTGALPGDPTHYNASHAERYAREALIPPPSSSRSSTTWIARSQRISASRASKSAAGAKTCTRRARH